MTEKKKRETRLQERMENLRKSLPRNIRNSAYFLMNNVNNELRLKMFEERRGIEISKTSRKKLQVMSNIRKKQGKKLPNDIEEIFSELPRDDILFTDKNVDSKFIARVQIFIEKTNEQGNKELIPKFVTIKFDDQDEYHDLYDGYVKDIEREYKGQFLASDITNLYVNRLYRHSPRSDIFA